MRIGGKVIFLFTFFEQQHQCPFTGIEALVFQGLLDKLGLTGIQETGKGINRNLLHGLHSKQGGNALLIQLGTNDTQLAGDIGRAGANIGFLGNIVKMDPLTVSAHHNTLSPENHAIDTGIQMLQGQFDLCFVKFLCGFYTPGGKDLVGMMVVMVMTAGAFMVVMVVLMFMMATAAFTLFMVVMLMIMVTAAALTFLVMMVVLMVMVGTMLLFYMAVMMLVTAFITVVVATAMLVMVMVVIVLVFFMMSAAALMIFLMMVVMLMVVVMAAAGAVLIMLMMMVMFRMFCLELCQFCCQSSLSVHGTEQLLTG